MSRRDAWASRAWATAVRAVTVCAAMVWAATAPGCGRAQVTTCGDDLAGVWRGPAGDYQALDRGGHIELYPMFAELPAELPPGVVAAPSVIDLTRATGTTASGAVTRRYECGAQFCRRTAPARLVTCQADRLTLEVAPVGPPDDWARCDGPPARNEAPTSLVLVRR